LYESHNPGALRYIVINEHFKRFFDQREPHDYGGVQVDALSFLMFFLIWGSPWSFVLPQVVAFGAQRSALRAPRAEHTPFQDSVLLILLAAAVPVLFFLAIPSRLIYYSIPALPAFALLCGAFWSAPNLWAAWQRKLAVGVFALAGIVICAAAWFVPPMLKGVPDLEVSPTLVQAIPAEALVIGTVLLAAGVALHLRKARTALALLVLLVGSLEVFNIGKFSDFDAISSSKKLVQALAPQVGDNCIWISEGSEEVGAAAGTAFYLRLATHNPEAFVWILDANDPHRPPPVYPGKKLKFFIDQAQLDALWNGSKPAVFITDFKRTDWASDKPHLPSQDAQRITVEGAGHRHVYVNLAAAKRVAATKASVK
jgi:hypothetical protein